MRGWAADSAVSVRHKLLITRRPAPFNCELFGLLCVIIIIVIATYPSMICRPFFLFSPWPSPMLFSAQFCSQASADSRFSQPRLFCFVHCARSSWSMRSFVTRLDGHWQASSMAYRLASTNFPCHSSERIPIALSTSFNAYCRRRMCIIHVLIVNHFAFIILRMGVTPTAPNSRSRIITFKLNCEQDNGLILGSLDSYAPSTTSLRLVLA